MFAAFFVAGLLVMRSEIGKGVGAAEVQGMVERGDVGRVMTGTYLLPFAGIAFVWFMAVVRRLVAVARTGSSPRSSWAADFSSWRCCSRA